jgi:hypothetical protein
MPTKTDRILSYLPSTFRALPKPTALYSVVDAFGNELLQAENSLAALMLAHWVDHADKGAELIDDLARIAALYGLAPRPEESVEEFRDHLKRYVRTFLDGTVTVQGILRVTAEALGLHIADAYDQMDTWWTRGQDTLVTVEPGGDDAASLLLGVDSVSVRGQAAHAARVIGKPDLSSAFNLGSQAKLRLKVDAAVPVDIDLAGSTTLEQIVQAINDKVSGVASSEGRHLVLRSPSEGAASRLEVEEMEGDAAAHLLGLSPHSYRGSDANKAQVTGKQDLSGGADLTGTRYLRLLIDGQHLAEVDCAVQAADPGNPTNVQLEQIRQAINQVLAMDVASHDGNHLILTSPTSGFNSSIAFQPAAAQDARERLFGPIDAFHAGREARPARATGINDLSQGVDLSVRAKLHIRVDNRPPVTVSCAGTDPANTLLSEITAVLTAQLGPGIASHDGRFLQLTSPIAGTASAIVFEPLPPDEDAAEILFGIASRIFEGAAAEGARFAGISDLSAGADLAALHAMQIAVDGGKLIEVNARSEASDPRKAKPGEIAKAINTALGSGIASDDGKHLILTSPSTGDSSAIVVKPLTETRYRRFVTRAFSTDDAAQAVFGFFAREAQGTPATGTRVIGKRDLSRGIDLRETRFLRLSVDDRQAVDVDCAGARARATMIGEVVDAINAQLKEGGLEPDVASHDGQHLILTSPTMGSSSRIAFEPPRAADAMGALLLGTQPAVFRGQNATRVTFTGVADLSAGADLPANAAVKLRIDSDEFEIPLTEAAPAHKTLIEVTIAINLKFGKTIAHHDGRRLILASPSTGIGSRIEFLVPGAADVTQAIFGISAPRAYHGKDAEPAEISGQELAAKIDLHFARFLRLAINGVQPIDIDCAVGAADPNQSTLAEIVSAVNGGLTAAQIPAIARMEGNRLVLATTTTGATSRIDLLPYTEGDARALLMGEIPEETTGNDPAPAVITGETDLLAPVNLSRGGVLRLSVDGERATDVDIAGAVSGQTFLDEIVARINGIYPGLASVTDDDRLRLTSPMPGESSRLTLSPIRALELIEYPPVPAQDPLPDKSPRTVRHGDKWTVENDGVADADLKIELTAPNGIYRPGFVNLAQSLRIRLMIVLSPGDRVDLWRMPTGSVHARIIRPDGAWSDIPDAQIHADALDEQKGCGDREGGQDKAAALVLPQGRSKWAYQDCYAARFDQDCFDSAWFVGKGCVERGVFNASRFTCPPPEMESTVFASSGEPGGPVVEIRFHWLQHQPGAFTVNLPADLPERFGGRFNQARFAKAGDNPEEFKDIVTEPVTDPDFLINRIASSALLTAKRADRVPIGFVAAVMPFRKPRRLAGGSETESARLYLAEKDVSGFIELRAREPGAWGNAIAVAARKAGPARFDVTISYQAARFENARRVALGGEALPALTEDLLKPGPVGVLQAKAGGIKAGVTRDRAASND